jgi:hypothetical protein
MPRFACACVSAGRRRGGWISSWATAGPTIFTSHIATRNDQVRVCLCVCWGGGGGWGLVSWCTHSPYDKCFTAHEVFKPQDWNIRTRSLRHVWAVAAPRCHSLKCERAPHFNPSWLQFGFGYWKIACMLSVYFPLYTVNSILNKTNGISLRNPTEEILPEE